ncbi:MAG: HD-GYP domain-containing protein, partial [Huintestinicola sp.]
IAHFHHEKWNGTGYPSRIAGKAIPFEARVMAVADVFDALVSKRVYKESYSFDKAFDIIESSGGEHFDPGLCNEFLQCRPQLEALFNSYTD